MPQPAQPSQEYYVYADRMTSPAGHKIYKGLDGTRRIKMPPNAAKYWIDQGAIGLTPKENLDENTRHMLAMMHGEPVSEKKPAS